MKVLFILNGEYNKKLENFLNDYDIVVAVDGGLNHLKNFTPHYVIGDFDSIDKKLLENINSNVIFKNNQDESDFLFALKYIIKKYSNIENIDVICATGDRIDHTICSIFTLINFDVNIKIIGINENIYVLKNNTINLKTKINTTISIIPLTDIKNIKSSGLKWEYNNNNLSLGFVNGISNLSTKENVLISVESGIILIIENTKLNIY